MRTRIETIER
jgi:hypothetical protein